MVAFAGDFTGQRIRWQAEVMGKAGDFNAPSRSRISTEPVIFAPPSSVKKRYTGIAIFN